MRSLRDAKITPGQLVLLRADFNVPLDQNSQIIDDFRLQAVSPTIEFLLKKKAKIILLCHLGRPNGRVLENLRLKPVARWLQKKYSSVEYFPEASSYHQIKGKISQSQSAIFLLENLRFQPGEEKNDPEFSQKLSSLGDLFVNDAFAVSHRCHASIVSLPQLLPSFAGLRLIQEIQALKKALSFKKDLVVVLGGAKAKSKIPAIEGLIKQGAIVLLGGILGNTFLAAIFGKNKVNGSIVEEESLPTAKKFLKKLDKEVAFAKIPGQTTRIWLPLDVIIAHEKNGHYLDLETIYFWPPLQEVVAKKKKIFDIGPRTIREYIGILKFAQGIIFNGPLGKFEETIFAKGTREVFQAIAQSPAFSLSGGGDSLAALEKFNLCHKIDYMSTGGGAMLDYIAQGILPGIEALGEH